MDTTTSYTIQIAEPLAAHWSEWLGGLQVDQTAVGTQLSGTLPDQCALLGVLNHIHALGLTLISVDKEIKNDTSNLNPTHNH